MNNGQGCCSFQQVVQMCLWVGSKSCKRIPEIHVHIQFLVYHCLRKNILVLIHALTGLNCQCIQRKKNYAKILWSALRWKCGSILSKRLKIVSCTTKYHVNFCERFSDFTRHEAKYTRFMMLSSCRFQYNISFAFLVIADHPVY